MRSLYNRMPVILPQNASTQWLNPAPRASLDLRRLLLPYPAAEMEAHPVSTLVSNPANGLPECILPN